MRAMPNRPALVGAGATGLFAAPGVTPRSARRPKRHAGGGRSRVGGDRRCAGCRHRALGQRAGLFLLAGGGDGARRRSIWASSADAARRLAVATLHGAGLLAHASDGDLARLRAGGHFQGRHDGGRAAHAGAADLRKHRRASRRSCRPARRGAGRAIRSHPKAMNALIFIVETLLSLLLLVFLLRRAAAARRARISATRSARPSCASRIRWCCRCDASCRLWARSTRPRSSRCCIVAIADRRHPVRHCAASCRPAALAVVARGAST